MYANADEPFLGSVLHAELDGVKIDSFLSYTQSYPSPPPNILYLRLPDNS